jgi:hypothetical protein
VAGAGADHPLAVERRGEGVADVLERLGVVAGRDERRDPRVAQDVERWAGLAGEASAVRAADAAGDLLGQRAVADARRAREPQELAQAGGVGVEAVAQERVAQALQARDRRVARGEVVDRRLDERQGPDAVRPARRGDQRAKGAVGVRDDVRARVEQRDGAAPPWTSSTSGPRPSRTTWMAFPRTRPLERHDRGHAMRDRRLTADC